MNTPILKISKRILVSIVCLSCFSIYAQSHIVEMMSNEMGMPIFVPHNLLIQPGDTVVWINVDKYYVHNVVADPGGVPKGAEPFESPSEEEFGKEWSYRFDQVGTYQYHCHPHADKGMKGTIIVGRESLPNEIRAGSGGGHSHHH